MIKKVKKIKLVEKENREYNLAIRDKKTKIHFMNYLIEHPEQRFWQIVRNWSGFSFILGSSHWDSDMFDKKYMKKNKVDIADTFYLENIKGIIKLKIR